MAALSHKSLWSAALVRVLRAADDQDVWRYVFDVLQSDLEISSLAIIEYLGDTMPRVLFYVAADDPYGERIAAYVQGAYLLDPFFQATSSERLSGCYTVEDLSSGDFVDSEYYKTFFSAYRLGDEINMFFQASNGTTIAVSLGREAGKEKFDRATRRALTDCHDFFLSLIEQFPSISTSTSRAPGHRRRAAGGISPEDQVPLSTVWVRPCLRSGKRPSSITCCAGTP